MILDNEMNYMVLSDGKLPINKIHGKSSISVPASLIQRQFWLLHQMYPESSAYNISSIFRITGLFNVAILQKSLNTIIRRHEIFRTTFSETHDGLMQIIAPECDSDISVKVAEGVFADREIDTMIKQEISRPFKLNEGPLIRSFVLKISEEFHLLIITFHHIVSDLQTKDTFGEELSSIYNALSINEDSLLSMPEYQYRHFSEWQIKWSQDEDCRKTLAFWEQELTEVHSVIELPINFQRPVIATFNGGAVELELNRELTEKLSLFCRRETTTDFLILFTAWVALLHRYTQKTSFAVGVPMTNRRKANYKSIMGCFVNILPITVDLSGNPSFSEAMKRLRMRMLAAHRHQETPLELIFKRAGIRRDPAYNPLFQTGFTFEHPMRLSFSGLQVESLYYHHGGSQLDLFATFWKSGERLRGVFEFNSDLFDRTTVERMTEHFLVIVSASLDNPEWKISNLPIMNELEFRRITSEWNDTACDIPDVKGIHRFIERQAQFTPTQTAVVCSSESLIYQELNQRANRLGRYFRSLGIPSNSPIGICIERSCDMLVAVLAVLKAGGAYVPLDPDFPPERISFMIRQTAMPIICTKSNLAGKITSGNARLVELDTEHDAIEKMESVDIADFDSCMDSLAYIIFTSGSTGQPKGVEITHGALLNFLLSMHREPGLTKDDVLAAVTTLSFDIAGLELFLPLFVGARVIIVPNEILSDGEQLSRLIQEHNVTCMQATPTTWRLIIAAGWKGSKDFRALCGGETFPPDLARELLLRTGGLWNMYGPTETTVWSTCCRITDADRQIPIGRPISNTKAYVLDTMLNPVPIGVWGELYIGGKGLAKGYHKQPDLTHEKFIVHHLAEGRLYKTGDLCRYRADGMLEFGCRVDNQVKVRGFRIEPGEIEAYLRTLSTIKDALVIAVEDAQGTRHLVAYVVLKEGRSLTVEELRSHLDNLLPKYMVPSIFVPLERLPLTPNNKIDRKALPDPWSNRLSVGTDFLPPSSDFEKELSEIWAEVLGLDRVGVKDNFFDMGGTSMLVMQVKILIYGRLKVDVPVIRLFQFPTINTLANFIRNNAAVSTEHVKIQARKQKDALSRQKQHALMARKVKRNSK